jgi:hypothetical protein
MVTFFDASLKRTASSAAGYFFDKNAKICILIQEFFSYFVIQSTFNL